MKGEVNVKLLKNVITLSAGVFLGQKVGKLQEKRHKNQETEKYRSYFYTLVRLYNMKAEGKPIDWLLHQKDFARIAIYGMGEMGRIMYEELKNTDITVVYGIDQAGGKHPDIKVIKMKAIQKEPDAIIVTIPFAYESVKNDLKKIVSCPVISLEHLLYEVEDAAF